MKCNVCGAEIPMGSPVCTNCGAATPVDDATVSGAGNYGQDAYVSNAAPKKSPVGLIIGIVAAIVVIAAVVTCLFLFVFNKKDGTYVCDTYSALGMDIELEVDGDEFTLTMKYTFGEESDSDTTKGTIEFKGDKVTMTAKDGDGEYSDVTGKYDKKEKTITVEEDGMKLEFTKEK